MFKCVYIILSGLHSTLLAIRLPRKHGTHIQAYPSSSRAYKHLVLSGIRMNMKISILRLHFYSLNFPLGLLN